MLSATSSGGSNPAARLGLGLAERRDELGQQPHRHVEAVAAGLHLAVAGVEKHPRAGHVESLPVLLELGQHDADLLALIFRDRRDQLVHLPSFRSFKRQPKTAENRHLMKSGEGR